MLARCLTVGVIFVVLGVVHVGDLGRAFGDPNGRYGLFTDSALSSVRRVIAHSPADRAGLQVGDRVDISANSADAILAFSGGPDIAVHAGDTLTVHVLGPHSRTIVLLADAEPSSNFPLIVVREFFLFIPLSLASLLLIVRPSAVTWWLFWMMVGSYDPPTSVFYFRILHTSAQREAFDIFRGIVLLLTAISSVMLVYSLAAQRLRGWRIAALSGAVFIGLEWFYDASHRSLFGGSPSIGSPLTVPVLVAYAALILIVIADAYRHTALQSRGKMLWLCGGLLLWTLAKVVDATLWPIGVISYGPHTLLGAVTLVFPVLCTYVLLATRVVDVRFALSRTVVYGLLSGGAVAIFAIVDLFLTRGLGESRFGLPADIAAAIALGFFMKNIHERADVVVDRVLFRQRYLAEAGIDRAANAVLHLHGAQAVADYVLDIPCGLLKLPGAALYRRAVGGFELERAYGWTDVPARYEDDDPLCAYLTAQLDAVRTADIPLAQNLPSQTVLAIPLTLRRKFGRFALYSAHADGTDIDPEESRALCGLLANAATTYDHLAAEALEEEVRRFRAMTTA